MINPNSKYFPKYHQVTYWDYSYSETEDVSDSDYHCFDEDFYSGWERSEAGEACTHIGANGVRVFRGYEDGQRQELIAVDENWRRNILTLRDNLKADLDKYSLENNKDMVFVINRQLGTVELMVDLLGFTWNKVKM